MPDAPTAQGGGPASPPAGASDGEPAPPARRTRPGRKFLTPVVLGVLGLAMLLAAFLVYPRTPELPTPGYSQLVVTSAVPVLAVAYSVTQVSAATTKMTVTVRLPAGVRPGAATLKVQLPLGTTFAGCRAPACTVLHQGLLTGSIWTKPLTFTSTGGSPPTATADFTVRARNFGVIFNGLTASAVIPQVTYQGPGKPEPTLLAAYVIPSAGSYDWSSFPPAGISGSVAAWEENLPSAQTPSRVAVGINHHAQSNHDTLALVAGTLLGLAGGALVSAIQELLNARD